MMTRRGLRSFPRKVFKKLLGGLVTSLLVTGVLLYTWTKPPLPHPYSWIPHPSTTPLPPHNPEDGERQGSAVERMVEQVGKKERGAVMPAAEKVQRLFRSISSADGYAGGTRSPRSPFQLRDSPSQQNPSPSPSSHPSHPPSPPHPAGYALPRGALQEPRREHSFKDIVFQFQRKQSRSDHLPHPQNSPSPHGRGYDFQGGPSPANVQNDASQQSDPTKPQTIPAHKESLPDLQDHPPLQDPQPGLRGDPSLHDLHHLPRPQNTPTRHGHNTKHLNSVASRAPSPAPRSKPFPPGVSRHSQTAASPQSLNSSSSSSSSHSRVQAQTVQEKAAGVGKIGRKKQGKESRGVTSPKWEEMAFFKSPQKGLHEGPLTWRKGFPDVSDVDPRLLTPGRSAGGEGVCSPHHHLVFVKVHKAASSTLANIIQRYGATRDLNFVLPNKPAKTWGYNYISRRGDVLTPSSILPPPPGGHYDLLWNHAIYNRTAFSSFMPADTVYVSILREPFQQFVSSYAFYHLDDISQALPSLLNPFTHYLYSTRNSDLLGYFRNKQSEDLGMGPQHVLNSSLRHQYLHTLNRELHLVLITEFFDESLVFLRRLMCWSIKDILYVPQNKNSYKPKFVFSGQDYARHQQLAAADYDLYQFFKHKFLRMLAAQSLDFEHEVTHFKEVLREVQKFCRQTPLKQFFVPSSPWGQAFTVSSLDCQLMRVHELTFLDKLVEINKAKTQQARPDLHHPDLNRPDLHRPDLDRPGLNRPDLNRPDLDHPDLNRPDLNRPDLNRPDLNRPDLNRPDLDRTDLNRPDLDRPDLNRPDLDLPGLNRPNLDRPDLKHPDLDRPHLQFRRVPPGTFPEHSSSIPP